MTTEPTIRALSLGAGVQSTTLALLAIEGTLPKPDVAIFADTGWEPAAVYRQVDRTAEAVTAAGIEFVVCPTETCAMTRSTRSTGYPSVPYLVRNPDGIAEHARDSA